MHIKFKIKGVSKINIAGTVYRNGDIVDLPDKYAGKNFLEPLEPVVVTMPQADVIAVAEKPEPRIEPMPSAQPQKRKKFPRIRKY